MVEALSKFWSHTPPPCVQLMYIAAALGIQQSGQKESIEQQDISTLAGSLGGGMIEGRPNDPMLDLLGI